MNIVLKKDKKIRILKSKMNILILINLFILLILNLFSLLILNLFLFRVFIYIIVIKVIILIFLLYLTKKNNQSRGILLNYIVFSIMLMSTLVINLTVLNLLWDFINIFIYPVIKIIFLINLSINANKYSLYQYLKDGYEITNYNELDKKTKTYIEKSKKKKRPSYLLFKF